MLTLHNLKGGISGQVFKELLREDVVLIGSNISKTEGSEWQTCIKFRRTDTISAPAYGFALCMHTAKEKEPFIIALSEDEARQKLKAWNYPTTEIEKLLKMEVS